MSLLLSGLGTVFVAGGVWMLRRRGQPPVAVQSAVPRVPEGALPVLTAPELLAPLAGQLAELARLVGLPTAKWGQYGEPLLAAYAEFCQQFPASEAHHHAHPGGLLEHTVDVAIRALRLRQGLMLPPGGQAEEISRLKGHWSLAVLIAALLHDIGKPLADLAVTCGRDRTETTWQPLAGSLIEQHMSWYRVGFVQGRAYTLHQRLAVILLQKLVPADAIAWLSDSNGPMPDLMAYLSGEEATTLAGIVTTADRESVAANLMTGPRVRLKAARAVPLIERLMAGLRAMLAEGLLPLNRDGAAAFVVEDEIWLVCKRVADELREYLEKREVVAPDGAPGLPSSVKNDRIFDTFQEYGALVPNPETGGAVWTVEVGEAAWSHQLTMLRFKLDRLYQPGMAPDAFGGMLKVVGKKQRQAPPANVDPLPTEEAFETARVTQEPVVLAPENEARSDESGTLTDPLAGLRALVADSADKAQTVTPAKTGADDYLDDLVDVTEADAPPDTPPKSKSPKAVPRTAPARIPPPMLRTPAPRNPDAPQVLPPVAPRTAAPPADAVPESAARLMAWVQTGVADGSLAYNITGALVHFAEEEGKPLMLLVTPRIFRHYLDSVGEQTGESGDHAGMALQREFFKAKWHRVTQPGKKNIAKFQVIRRTSPGGSNKEGGLLTVVVIENPERFFNPVPPPNPYLAAFTDTSDK